MKTSKFRACLALGLLACTVNRDRTLAAEDPTAKPGAPVIAAIVNGDPIYVAEIEQLLAQARGSRHVSRPPTPVMQAETLRQIVNRRVAEEAFKRNEAYVKKSEIDAALKKIEAQAKSQRLSLEQFIAERGATVNALRHELAWQIGWPKYVEGNLADALEGYFKEHHKDFDGTVVRVSHILLRPERPAEGPAQIIERADKLRAEIEAGKLTFEQAAEKHSAGPSRHRGGDLGFFPRSGVMVEEFSKAAFALAKGEISQPIRTAFGVHLIRAIDIRPGNRQWTEAAAQMKVAASQDLFAQLAKKERANAKIEFTGKVPYFKPETDELVMPGGMVLQPTR
jgi:parvulin-like peptidyl-prolyl isomerase